MGNLNICGPPVYPDIDLNIPFYGPMGADTDLVGIVEAATNIWDQNHFDPTQPTLWDNETERLDALGWAELIGKAGREQYQKAGLSEHVWLNRLRHYLKPRTDWSWWLAKAPQSPKPFMDVLFDPIHWRIYADEGQYASAGDKGLSDFAYTWVPIDQAGFNIYKDNLYYKLRSDYDSSIGQTFTWDSGIGAETRVGWGPSQNAKADINLPPPYQPPIEGFGIAQFLEWLTGLSYFEIFMYEYGVVLSITLLSLFWTDFYPFFKELGMVQ